VFYGVGNANVDAGADHVAGSVVTYQEKVSGWSRQRAEPALESKWTRLRAKKSSGIIIVA